jgi:hypothetical protein
VTSAARALVLASCSGIVGLASCARTTEFIGSAPPAAACIPSDPPPAPPVVAEPAWNCGDRCWHDPGLDPSVPALFAGAAPDPVAANRPTLRYPLAGSLHPINLPRGAVHFERARGEIQRIFRVRVTASDVAGTSYDFFVPCTPPMTSTPAPAEHCHFALPDSAWPAIAIAHRGGSAVITVAGRDQARQVVASSDPVTVTFSESAITGGVHYFSPIPNELRRYVFGARGGSEPLVTAGTAANRLDCAGCHSVSRDGATLAFAAEYSGRLTVARTTALDQPSIAPGEPPLSNAIAPAISRDGRYVLGRSGPDGSVAVRDTSGRLVSSLTRGEVGGRIHFPEWSPDGRSVVATRSMNEQREWSPLDGEIVVLPFSAGKLGPPTPLFRGPSDEMHLYPTWSPDGAWIAFVSAPTAGGEAFGNLQKRLRLVASTGAPPIHELTAATHELGKRATYPRFAPALQTGCKVLFLTFSSRMDYGLLRWRNSLQPNGGLSQLWMAAIDLRKLGTADPSSPPVWLPFQDVAKANVLATWSDRVPCANSAACGVGASCAADRYCAVD